MDAWCLCSRHCHASKSIPCSVHWVGDRRCASKAWRQSSGTLVTANHRYKACTLTILLPAVHQIVYDDLCAHHSAARRYERACMPSCRSHSHPPLTLVHACHHSLGFDHDVASEYASILAQSGALDDEHGGGSVTSFPLVSVQPGQDREHSENEKLVEQVACHALCTHRCPSCGTMFVNPLPSAYVHVQQHCRSHRYATTSSPSPEQAYLT